VQAWGGGGEHSITQPGTKGEGGVQVDGRPENNERGKNAARWSGGRN